MLANSGFIKILVQYFNKKRLNLFQYIAVF